MSQNLMPNSPWGLFEVYGVELEYMIVDKESLSIRPIADQVFHACTGEYASDVERDDMAWSNELALHVVEFKTNGPTSTFKNLAQRFQKQVEEVNGLLRPMSAQLMPTAMHPWMNPATEFKLWPHENSPIYEAFHTIFDCGSHGWANLQSAHLNLPFSNDEEFGRLHAAIRLLMPIMPALSASSPIVEGKITGLLDNRLEHYRNHTRRIPCLTARVIPEPVFSYADYESQIYQPIQQQLIPFDTHQMLQPEWSNARGAIARFDRGAIEIRILDVQECPAADVAICQTISKTLQEIVSERWTSLAQQQSVPVAPLADLFLRTLAHGDQAIVDEQSYLAHFGITKPMTAGELWQAIVPPACANEHLQRILQQGPLARRILRAAERPDRSLRDIYDQLCQCLALGQSFDPAA